MLKSSDMQVLVLEVPDFLIPSQHIFGIYLDVHVDYFKCILDKYLATVPDEPQIRGYTSMRRDESNSLTDMAKLAESQTGQAGRDSH